MFWVFRTLESGYFVTKSDHPVTAAAIRYTDKHGVIGSWATPIGRRRPKGLPPLKPGACVLVELVPAVKKKKARKV